MRLTWKSRENALAERVECGWGGGGVEVKMEKGRCSHSSFKICYALLRSVFVLLCVVRFGSVLFALAPPTFSF